MSSRKYAAAQRRIEAQKELDVDEAYKSLQEMTAGWKSDRHFTPRAHRRDENYYDDMPMEEMDVDEDTEMKIATPPKKRKAILERADTPVMSNASKKKDQPSALKTPQIKELQSPPPTPYVPFVPPIATTVSQSSRDESHRYYEATRKFRKIRVALNNQDAMITDGMGTKITEEQKADEMFLNTLRTIASDRVPRDNYSMEHPARKEANFWTLLLNLRHLDVSALIMEDIDTAKSEASRSIQEFMDSIAGSMDLTPLELVKLMRSEKAPLAIRRRVAIIDWLHSCFNAIVGADATRARSGQVLRDSNIVNTQGLAATTTEKEVLDNALSLFLAGRLTDAQKLVHESGIGWRAASWEGASPHGYVLVPNEATQSLDRQQVGNVARFLWKVNAWKMLEASGQNPSGLGSEKAITALLCNDFRSALINPSLRSWEKALYSGFYCTMGRIEDSLIHMHNSRTRDAHPPYPGTEYEAEEVQHLSRTQDFSGLDDSGIVSEIDKSPFPEMRCNDPMSQITAAFLSGRRSICSFFQTALGLIENFEEEPFLRCMCHLAVFLDALANAEKPKILSGASEWIEMVIMFYVRFLKKNDLFEYIVLYVSFLPEILQSRRFAGEMRKSFLSKTLVGVQEEKLRRTIVAQLNEYVSGEERDFVVENIIDIVFEEEDSSKDTATVSEDDTKKMSVLKWVSFEQEDIGAALWYTNTLIRRFILLEKKNSFYILMEDCRSEYLQKVVEGLDSAEGFVKYDFEDTFQSSVDEHKAYEHLLEALKMKEEWQEVLESQTPKLALVDDPTDELALSQDGESVSTQLKRSNLKRSKRESIATVVKISLATIDAFLNLLHSGDEFESLSNEKGIDDSKVLERAREIQKVREKILPQCVVEYYQVCVETARWLEESIMDYAAEAKVDFDGAVEELGASLDDQTIEESHPFFWREKGLGLAEIVASGTFMLMDTFSEEQLGDFVVSMQELKMMDMMKRE